MVESVELEQSFRSSILDTGNIITGLRRERYDRGRARMQVAEHGLFTGVGEEERTAKSTLHQERKQPWIHKECNTNAVKLFSRQCYQ